MRGAKMWIVACSLMAVEMDSRTEEVKISRDWRFVIRRVLLGGVGCERGGRSEKSRDMLKERRFEGDDEAGGVEMSMAMVVECGVALVLGGLRLFGGGVVGEKKRKVGDGAVGRCYLAVQCGSVGILWHSRTKTSKVQGARVR